MADLNQQAMDWAQSNPNDEKSIHIRAKAWANMNPKDPDSARVLAKANAALDQLRNKPQDNAHSTTDVMGQLSRQNNSNVVQNFKAEARDLFPGMQKQSDQSIWQNTKQNLPILGAAAATSFAPEAGALLGTTLSTGGAAIGSVGRQVLDHGSVDGMDTAKDALLYGIIPGTIGAAASKIGGVLKVGADEAQQVAMGMKKHIPGVGTAAIDEGVRGTVKGMRGQMDNALATNGANTDNMISQLKGSVSSEPVANKVADYPLNRYQSKNGLTTPAGEDLIDDGYNRASEISNRGEVTPEDARKLAQTAESAEGFSGQGAPKASYNSQLARVEGKGYRDELRQMGDDQGLDVSGGFDKLHKLMQGQKALSTPQTLSTNSPVSSVGNTIFKNTIGSGPVSSYAAKGLDASGNTISNVDADSVRKLQMLLQSQGSGNDQ